MKRLSYIGILWTIFISYTYGQSINIAEEYQGDPFISTINMQQLEQDCKRDVNYAQMNAAEKEQDDNRCPLRRLPFNFDVLPSTIKPYSYIYQNDDFSLVLDGELYEYTKEGDNYKGLGLALMLIKQYKKQSKISLTFAYKNQTTSRRIGFQYYYIAPSGDIYILFSTENDTGISPLFWKHYKIDNEQMKIVLKEMLINDVATKIQYQIIYPSQFNVLSSGELAIESKPEQYDLCLTEKEEDKHHDCYFNAYNYYLNELQEKSKLLDEKKKIETASFPALKQEVDAICLMTEIPSYPYDINSYLAEITRCFIQYFKDEIKQTEEELAK